MLKRDGPLKELKALKAVVVVVVDSKRHVALITTVPTETMINYKQDQRCPFTVTIGKKQFTQTAYFLCISIEII